LSSFFTSIACRMAGVRRVVSTEHNITTYSSRPYFYRLAAKIYLRLNARAIAISAAVQKCIVSACPNQAGKTHVIHNGVDLCIFNPERYRYEDSIPQRHRKPLRIGTLVRDDPRKGFEVFRKSAGMIKEQYDDMDFFAGVQPGNGCGTDSITAYTLKNGQEGVAEYLGFLDVFVLPSLEEGLGLAAIEAMAMGKPVIASRVGGLPEVVDDFKTGLLFTAGDVHALASAILFLKEKPDVLQYMSAGAVQTAKERFSLERMIDEVEILYRHL